MAKRKKEPYKLTKKGTIKLTSKVTTYEFPKSRRKRPTKEQKVTAKKLVAAALKKAPKRTLGRAKREWSKKLGRYRTLKEERLFLANKRSKAKAAIERIGRLPKAIRAKTKKQQNAAIKELTKKLKVLEKHYKARKKPKQQKFVKDKRIAQGIRTPKSKQVASPPGSYTLSFETPLKHDINKLDGENVRNQWDSFANSVWAELNGKNIDPDRWSGKYSFSLETADGKFSSMREVRSVSYTNMGGEKGFDVIRDVIGGILEDIANASYFSKHPNAGTSDYDKRARLKSAWLLARINTED